jgi:hypothetical protein
MKRDMNETEFSRLEVRLRQLRPATVPAAPRSLREFVVSVPRTPRRSRIAVAFSSSTWLRGGAVGAALAGALLIALAVSSLLVGMRPTQPPGPASGGEWIWQTADGTDVGTVYPVPNGFIAGCWIEATVCTSRDALHWSLPADAGVASMPSGVHFMPSSYARIGDTYVSVGTTDISGHPLVIYESPNGVEWALADPSQYPGVPSAVAAVGDKFYAVASGHLYTSTDGSMWVEGGALPAGASIGVRTDAGLLVEDQVTADQWISFDASTWTKIELPASVREIFGVESLPDGSFAALGRLQGERPSAYELMRSADGHVWFEDPGARSFGSSLMNLVALKDRLVVTTVGATNDRHLWQSTDWGATWRPVLGPDGTQVEGYGIAIGDRLGVETTADLALTLVGSPNASWTPAPSEVVVPPDEPSATPLHSGG